MPLSSLTCPICLATLRPAKPVEEGTRLRCPKCKGAFVAESAPPPEEEPPPEAVEPPAEEEPAEVVEATDDEDDRPRRKPKRRDDDEEEEDRPKRKSRKKSGVPLWAWLVGGGVGLFLLCGCCGVGGWLMYGDMLGGNVSMANYNQIKRGMSEAQVRTIMGAPRETADRAGMRVDTWKSGDSYIVISFANGKAVVGMCHITNGAGFEESQGPLP